MESTKILRHLELIDDEASEYGIKIVKCSDRLMAKKFGYRKPPGLTYFRKTKPLNYDGDIDDEEELLDWLTNPINMEMHDQIEQVNRKMFQKIRQNSDHLAVFFYSEDCKQCPKVLAEIEHIDDEAENSGIKFVKIDDKQVSQEIHFCACNRTKGTFLSFFSFRWPRKLECSPSRRSSFTNQDLRSP